MKKHSSDKGYGFHVSGEVDAYLTLSLTKGPPIYRITIDEKLSENLIRILIARCNRNMKKYSVEKDFWTDEEEQFITPESYQSLMKIIPSKSRKFKWNQFQEGQVFIAGKVKSVSQTKSKFLFAKSTRSNIYRVDHYIKGIVKSIYEQALTGGLRDAAPDK